MLILHITTFYLMGSKEILRELSILVMHKLEILPLISLDYITILVVNLQTPYINSTVFLLPTMIHHSLNATFNFINTVRCSITLCIALKQLMSRRLRRIKTSYKSYFRERINFFPCSPSPRTSLIFYPSLQLIYTFETPVKFVIEPKKEPVVLLTIEILSFHFPLVIPLFQIYPAYIT